MTIRSLLYAMRPWRCLSCMRRVSVVEKGLVRRCGRCARPTVYQPSLRGWLRCWWLGLAPLLLLSLLASRSSAAEPGGSYVLQFRGEAVTVTSECGKPKGGGILKELETGYQRAARDLAGTGVAVPKLGEYAIRLMREPGCPGNSIACSTTPAGAPKWSVVKALCGAGRKRNGDRAVDHELQHFLCVRVRPLVVPPKSIDELRRVSEACGLADHPDGQSHRFDVSGRRVPR